MAPGCRALIQHATQPAPSRLSKDFEGAPVECVHRIGRSPVSSDNRFSKCLVLPGPEIGMPLTNSPPQIPKPHRNRDPQTALDQCRVHALDPAIQHPRERSLPPASRQACGHRPGCHLSTRVSHNPFQTANGRQRSWHSVMAPGPNLGDQNTWFGS